MQEIIVAPLWNRYPTAKYSTEWAAETALFGFSGLCLYFHSDPEKKKCLAAVIKESKYVKIRVFNWSLIQIYSFVSWPEQFNQMKIVATVQELKGFVPQPLENSYRIELRDLANSLATFLLQCSAL